jgi:hypothetical protein
MTSDRITGTVCRLLDGGHCFVTPADAQFDDRRATIFCHCLALNRCGIAASDLMVGSRLSFRTKPPRFEAARLRLSRSSWWLHDHRDMLKGREGMRIVALLWCMTLEACFNARSN